MEVTPKWKSHSYKVRKHSSHRGSISDNEGSLGLNQLTTEFHSLAIFFRLWIYCLLSVFWLVLGASTGKSSHFLQLHNPDHMLSIVRALQPANTLFDWNYPPIWQEVHFPTCVVQKKVAHPVPTYSQPRRQLPWAGYVVPKTAYLPLSHTFC